jgi:urease accessory protein
MIAAQMRLQAWLSPAFPIGAFAYSHGIEWAVETGTISDADTLRKWIDDVLRRGTGRSDAILLRHAHAVCHDPTALDALAELAVALCPARERRLETTAQGEAFARAAAPWHDLPPLPYPVAVGTIAGRSGIEPSLATACFLQAFASNLISAAVRLVPLGQSDGLLVLAALEATVLAVTGETAEATLDDIGGCAFMSDIAAMRHESQYTRLFRS